MSATEGTIPGPNQIAYVDNKKYQLVHDHVVKIGIIPEEKIVKDLIELDTDGILTIKKFYAWDGPSGPAVDTKTLMRASLVHDALYELIRDGFLSEDFRRAADDELERIALKDGVKGTRAEIIHWAVDNFGEAAVKNPVTVHIAPEDRR